MKRLLYALVFLALMVIGVTWFGLGRSAVWFAAIANIVGWVEGRDYL